MTKLLLFCIGLVTAAGAFGLSCWLVRAVFGLPWLDAAVWMLAVDWACQRAGSWVRMHAL